MGTPEYCPLSRRQAITNIIDSVAQEQAALSMILSAEGDKLRRLICTPEVCPEQLLAANRSIEKTINAVSRLETVLICSRVISCWSSTFFFLTSRDV